MGIECYNKIICSGQKYDWLIYYVVEKVSKKVSEKKKTTQTFVFLAKKISGICYSKCDINTLYFYQIFPINFKVIRITRKCEQAEKIDVNLKETTKLWRHRHHKRVTNATNVEGNNAQPMLPVVTEKLTQWQSDWVTSWQFVVKAYICEYT